MLKAIDKGMVMTKPDLSRNAAAKVISVGKS